jgi:two-component system phosphate regulon response regulator PhoB
LVSATYRSANQAARSRSEIEVESRPDKGQPRVLVVEDDDSVASMLAICLAAAGFEVARVACGAEALAILEGEAVNAILLDLSLPDGLGGSVLDWLRRVSGPGAPPYLVMSALEPGEVTKRYGPLAENFVPKPFDPWALIRRLEGLLEGPGPSQTQGESSGPAPAKGE